VLLPEGVSQDHDGRAAAPVVVGARQAPGRGRDAEGAEVTAAHEVSLDAARLTPLREVETRPAEGQHVGEDPLPVA
jgi:hypothetical protein